MLSPPPHGHKAREKKLVVAHGPSSNRVHDFLFVIYIVFITHCKVLIKNHVFKKPLSISLRIFLLSCILRIREFGINLIGWMPGFACCSWQKKREIVGNGRIKDWSSLRSAK